MASNDDSPRRVDVGFAGGQELSVRLRKEAYEGLIKALEDGKSERWHDLTTEDSDIAVDLAQVVYVRLDTEEHRVGF
jgi:hypothetical protein